MTPAIAKGIPSGASSNIDIGSTLRSRNAPFTSRLVDVPISVQQPPRIDA
jgi:hypothetical protein